QPAGAEQRGRQRDGVDLQRLAPLVAGEEEPNAAVAEQIERVDLVGGLVVEEAGRRSIEPVDAERQRQEEDGDESGAAADGKPLQGGTVSPLRTPRLSFARPRTWSAATDVLLVWLLSAASWLPLLSGQQLLTADGCFHTFRTLAFNLALRGS